MLLMLSFGWEILENFLYHLTDIVHSRLWSFEILQSVDGDAAPKDAMGFGIDRVDDEPSLFEAILPGHREGGITVPAGIVGIKTYHLIVGDDLFFLRYVQMKEDEKVGLLAILDDSKSLFSKALGNGAMETLLSQAYEIVGGLGIEDRDGVEF